MTKYLYLLYLLGYNIFSNYKLAFPHTPVDKAFITKIVKEDILMPGDNAFGLDEIDMYIDSRRSVSQGNLLISYFIKQVRKKSIKLLYATQYKHSVDRRLRGLTRTDIMCQSRNINVDCNTGKEKIMFIYNQIYVNGQHLGSKRMVGNKWFDMYDTKELITID